MVTLKSFTNWAVAKHYPINKQGIDWAIFGVSNADGKLNTPIGLGNHDRLRRDGIPDRVLQEIAFRLGISKHDLEEEIKQY